VCGLFKRTEGKIKKVIHADSIFYPENDGRNSLWNVGTYQTTRRSIGNNFYSNCDDNLKFHADNIIYEYGMWIALQQQLCR
jgi:hypothetical protein